MNKNSINSTSIGNLGEDAATSFLESKGYVILERNYRAGRSEIDIIATIKNTIIFFEVKFRANSNYGFPEQHIDQKKVDMILRGAESYVEKTNWAGPIRFDVVSIIAPNEILHIEDAF